MLSPFNLPQGILLLITDELSAPADFLLHRGLHQHLKENNNINRAKSKATILSVSEGLTRWKAVASRSNMNLDNCGLLEFVDVLSHVRQIPLQKNRNRDRAWVGLKPVFDLVLDSLKGEGGTGLVILDDVSVLEWIGFSLVDVVRFVRALRAACLKSNATLVIRHHRVSNDDDDGNEPDELFSHLYQVCTYHLEVRGLASGRSGSVSGEVALHAGPATIPKDVNLLPRSRAMQYRLTDGSAVFFEKGTGGAVL